MTRPFRPPEAHLRQNRPDITPADARGRAFPIGDPDRPHAKPEAILAYLDVENSPRYQPTAGRTYCNVYACDYCYLLGAYLPRVWWTERALDRIAAGESVGAVYGSTVAELNVNALHGWFEDYGVDYGWTRAAELASLQRAANEWRASVIVAKNGNARRSGHVAVVIPERFGLPAVRAGAEVVLPVQSQAGRVNRAASTGGAPWWEDGRFAAYGFWTHQPSR